MSTLAKSVGKIASNHKLILLVPSKIWAFFSCQIAHIMQWEMIFQITVGLSLLNSQNLINPLARRSITEFFFFFWVNITEHGITQWTPYKENTIFRNSLTTWQCNIKCSIFSTSFLHMQHQSNTLEVEFEVLALIWS